MLPEWQQYYRDRSVKYNYWRSYTLKAGRIVDDTLSTLMVWPMKGMAGYQKFLIGGETDVKRETEKADSDVSQTKSTVRI